MPRQVGTGGGGGSRLYTPRRGRCKECVGCRTTNCGKCRPCLGMTIYGGDGTGGKVCIKRPCTDLQFVGGRVQPQPPQQQQQWQQMPLADAATQRGLARSIQQHDVAVQHASWTLRGALQIQQLTMELHNAQQAMGHTT